MSVIPRLHSAARRHPARADALGVLPAALLTLAVGAGTPPGAAPVWLLSLAATVPLCWRRTRPTAAAAAVAAALLLSLVLQAVPYPALWAVPWAVYSVSAHGSVRGRRALLAAGVLGAVLLGHHLTHAALGGAAQMSWWERGLMWLSVSGGAAVVVLAAFAFGGWRRLSLLRDRELLERAQRLERERDQERRLAAQDERTRIAREMHDVVAHSLSVIIAQADGARYAVASAGGAPAPETASAALATIAATGRSSLTQMRRLLGVLRTDDGGALAPLPGLADLPALVAGCTGTGADVRLRVHGEPEPGRLPSGAELAVYRIVQEALTNALRHAPGLRTVTVELRWTREGLSGSVHNDGVTADPRSAPAPGNGLRGMRERADLYAGTVSAGPCPPDGFRVRFSVPHQER